MSNNCNYLVNNSNKIVTKWGLFTDKRLQNGNKTRCGYNIQHTPNNTLNIPNKYNNILKPNFIYNN